MSRSIRISLTWSESLVEQVKTYPQQSREGMVHVLDQVARVGGMADRLHASVPVDAVPVGRVGEYRYLIMGAVSCPDRIVQGPGKTDLHDSVGLYLERDGITYQALWVPVEGGE